MLKRIAPAAERCVQKNEVRRSKKTLRCYGLAALVFHWVAAGFFGSVSEVCA